MLALWEKIKREPALLLGLLAAGFALAASFGLELSKEQTGSITAVVVAILALVTRQNVTPNVSVAAKEGPPPADALVAGPAADVPDGEPVEVFVAGAASSVPTGEDVIVEGLTEYEREVLGAHPPHES
jgi:hypothetical protein